jgi:hypothetical protein
MLVRFLFAPVAAITILASSAKAAFIDIDLAGWTSNGTFTSGDNSSTTLDLGAFSQITGFDWTDLSFTAHDPSYLSEFVLSLNTSDGVTYFDWGQATRMVLASMR